MTIKPELQKSRVDYDFHCVHTCGFTTHPLQQGLQRVDDDIMRDGGEETVVKG